MNSDPKSDQEREDAVVPESLPAEQDDDLPGFQHVDWDEIQSGILTREEITVEELEDGEAEGGLPDEDDDNPYSESDKALPDDEEERTIRRNFEEEGGPFDDN